MREIKWFLGENSSRVFAVYKASFEGTNITDEVQWLIPTGVSWEPTSQVSDWYFIGNDTVWPSTQETISKYLPNDVLR